MVIGAQQLQSQTWFKQTADRLIHDGLAPTPNNYAVYYYYFAGTNPGLKTAVEGILTQDGGLSQLQCDELFLRYLSVEAEQKAISHTNNIIEQEITRVLGVIDQAASGTNQFTESLDNFSGQLSGGTSLEGIREAVTKIVAETRSIAQQNEKLSSQLTEATQQLVEVRQNLDQVHKESQIDALTEVGNRKFFDKELTYAIAEARDNAQPLALLMIDIDHFKKFNDTYGHLIGDQVLRLVAHTLVENLKGRDVIARYGGEEFVILLPQTKVTDAEKVANQLRAVLATKNVKRRSTNESLGSITISIGAAEFCVGEERDSFIARADGALYKAKQTGRNKVMLDILTVEQIKEFQSKIRLKY